ncbi:MAG: hypothetical protein ACK4YF_03455 [Exilispira sp.]
MKEKVYKIINLMEKEYNLYLELLFNEMDKGSLLYQQEIELFNTKNENSRIILNEIGSIIDDKKSILENIRTELNQNDINNDINIEELVKKYVNEKYKDYLKIKNKLINILNILSQLNEKNKVILDTTYAVSKIVIEGLKKENIYNEKGSLCESSFSTVRYSV